MLHGLALLRPWASPWVRWAMVVQASEPEGVEKVLWSAMLGQDRLMS